MTNMEWIVNDLEVHKRKLISLDSGLHKLWPIKSSKVNLQSSQVNLVLTMNERIIHVTLVSWQSKGTPPNATPPRNKALLRDY